MSESHTINLPFEDTVMADLSVPATALPLGIQPVQTFFFNPGDAPSVCPAVPAVRLGDCSDERWEALKPEIDRLWNFENLKFNDLVLILRDEFRFYPTKRQFGLRIKRWGFNKYVRKIEMAAIARKRRERTLKGKSSVFYVREHEVPAVNIERWQNRNSYAIHAAAPTPQGIICYTPEESGPPSPDAQPASSSELAVVVPEAAEPQNPFARYANLDIPSSPKLSRLMNELKLECETDIPGMALDLDVPSSDLRVSSISPKKTTESTEISNRIKFVRIVGSPTSAPGNSSFGPSLIAETRSGCNMGIRRLIEISPFPTAPPNPGQRRKSTEMSPKTIQQQRLVKLKRELDALKESKGPEAPETLDVMMDLAVLLSNQRKYEKAEKLFYRVFDCRERVFGFEDWGTLQALLKFMMCLVSHGKYSILPEDLFSSLSELSKIFGSESETAITCMLIEAEYFLERRMFEEAEKILRNILQIRLTNLGPRNEWTMIAISNLSGVLRLNGRLLESEELTRAELSLRQISNSLSNEALYGNLHNLARILSDQKRLGECLKMLEETAEKSSKALGLLHERTLMIRSTQARCLMEMQLLPESAALYRQTFANQLEVLGPAHKKTLDTLENLGHVLFQMGSLQKAAKCFEKALAVRENIYSIFHPDTQNCSENLGIIFIRMDSWDKAAKYLSKSLEGRVETFGLSHPETVDCLENLALSMENQGSYLELLELYRAILHDYERAKNLEHPNVAKLRDQIDRIERKQNLSVDEHINDEEEDPVAIMEDAPA